MLAINGQQFRLHVRLHDVYIQGSPFQAVAGKIYRL